MTIHEQEYRIHLFYYNEHSCATLRYSRVEEWMPIFGEEILNNIDKSSPTGNSSKKQKPCTKVYRLVLKPLHKIP